MDDWTPCEIHRLAWLVAEVRDPTIARQTLERLYSEKISIQQAIATLRAYLAIARLEKVRIQ